MPPRIDALTKRVAEERARRDAAQQRESVAWEPRPLWLWISFWAFARRDHAAGPSDFALDLDGWQWLVRSLAIPDSDEAALDALLGWAEQSYCGIATRCTASLRPSAYLYLRDIVAEHRKRTGQPQAVSWVEDAEVVSEGCAIVLAELEADRASAELLRLDPWGRFYEHEE